MESPKNMEMLAILQWYLDIGLIFENKYPYTFSTINGIILNFKKITQMNALQKF